MDSLLLWKPWWHNSGWRPFTEGLHVDQNPFSKPDKLCVQGMLALYDVTEETGGLEVVPKSHLPETQDRFREMYPGWRGMSDFCVISSSSPLITDRKLLLANAGDLILWDSRTIHGGVVGTGKDPETDTVPRLARLSMTVCMVPRSRASPEVLERRKQGFQQGLGFTHWPNEVRVTSYADSKYKPIELTQAQLQLL
jgi:hypothetical protein